MKRIYLDNAAATPLDKHVFDGMRPFLKDLFGNPSTLYEEGVVTKHAVEKARESIADIMVAHKDEICFTGSGTESDNLAVQGVVRASLGVYSKPHVITSSIEHPAVLETVKILEKKGVIEATYIGVNEKGLVDSKEVKEALKGNTVLVSVMYANSEVGTVQPVREIVKMVREVRDSRNVGYPYVHTDACQAVNYLRMSVEKLGVDLMTFNGSKIYGPKGIGMLYIRRGVNIEPIVFGGGQESGLRSGTENVAGIIGISKALEITESIKEKESQRLVTLRDYFMQQLEEISLGIVINGDRQKRLPNNVHITVPDIEDDVLVVELDAKGIACSSKSACKTKAEGASHVVLAMRGEVKGSHLRFSLGRDTTKKDINYTVNALRGILKKYKDINFQ
ncbi:MAG: cysteine desulfurase [Candidatus Pacebacteria bacterium]|nr:cysteine desulfurase [Candidatus Paceibacterota bacterium]